MPRCSSAVPLWRRIHTLFRITCIAPWLLVSTVSASDAASSSGDGDATCSDGAANQDSESFVNRSQRHFNIMAQFVRDAGGIVNVEFGMENDFLRGAFVTKDMKKDDIIIQVPNGAFFKPTLLPTKALKALGKAKAKEGREPDLPYPPLDQTMYCAGLIALERERIAQTPVRERVQKFGWVNAAAKLLDKHQGKKEENEKRAAEFIDAWLEHLPKEPSAVYMSKETFSFRELLWSDSLDAWASPKHNLAPDRLKLLQSFREVAASTKDEFFRDLNLDTADAEWDRCQDLRNSRSIPYGEDQSPAAIPVLDDVNHMVMSSNINADFGCDTPDRCIARAVRDIAAGEFVHICYGQHADTYMLVHYGFALPDNPILAVLPSRLADDAIPDINLKKYGCPARVLGRNVMLVDEKIDIIKELRHSLESSEKTERDLDHDLVFRCMWLDELRTSGATAKTLETVPQLGLLGPARDATPQVRKAAGIAANHLANMCRKANKWILDRWEVVDKALSSGDEGAKQLAAAVSREQEATAKCIETWTARAKTFSSGS